jgi:integrase
LINFNPRYRKHKASGHAVVTIQGKDFYLGRWQSRASRDEYDRLIAEWLANGRRLAPLDRVPADFSIGELVDRFWTHAQSYYPAQDGVPTGELGTYRYALACLTRLYGRTPVREFGPLALEAARNEMIAKNWSRKVINKHVGRLKHVFKWGVSKELVAPSIYQALATLDGLRLGKTTARESPPVKPVPDDVVEATLPHLSRTVAAMVRIQRLTGARPGEICCMRTGDIDRSGKIWSYRPSKHKTLHLNHQREILIGKNGQSVLQPFLRLDPTAFIFSPQDAERERREARHAARKTPISYGNAPGTNRRRKPKRTPGEQYDVAAYRRAIVRAADAADLWSKGGRIIANDDRIFPRWHPHQLRHTAATEIRKRFGIEAAQHVLGHATLSVTEIYAEKNSAVARQIAAKIG